MTHNNLVSYDDISELTNCNELKVVDLSHNNLDDPRITEVSIKHD